MVGGDAEAVKESERDAGAKRTEHGGSKEGENGIQIWNVRVREPMPWAGARVWLISYTVLEI